MSLFVCPAWASAQQPLPVAPTARIALRYEVPASAVAAALATEGLAIAPARLHLAMPLTAARPVPQMHLASAELERDGSLLLRVRCRIAGDCMPFFATVASEDREATLTALAAMHGPLSQPGTADVGALAPVAPPSHPRGIAVGTRVTLELTDAQMRIHLPAVAIDTGAPGSEVRVASLDRKHTYRGIVVDAGNVKGGL